MSIFNWVDENNQYVQGEKLLVGKWRVAGVHYSGVVPRNEPKKWMATCDLPGIKKTLSTHETMEKAKEAAERAVTYWLKMLPDMSNLMAANEVKQPKQEEPSQTVLRPE